MKFMNLVGLCDFSEPSEKHPKIFQRMHDSRGGMKQGFCLCFWKRSLFFFKKKNLNFSHRTDIIVHSSVIVVICTVFLGIP